MTVGELKALLDQFSDRMDVVIASSPDAVTKFRTACAILDVYECKDAGTRLIRLGHPRATSAMPNIVLIEDEEQP